MSKDYFAQYESPNIVIVPTVTNVTTKKHSLDATAVTASYEPSTIRQVDIKYPNVLSETYENSFMNNDRNMSTNVRDIDSVEEALRQLHNVQTVPGLLSSQHQVTFIPNSKYAFQKNLIDLTNTNNIKTDRVTLKSFACSNEQEKHNKVGKCINVGTNEEHVPDFLNADMTEQSVSRNRPQNINRSTYSNIVTINNLSSTTKSQKKESRNIINQTEDSHYKSSRKRNRKQEVCNNKDENKICLEQRQVLKVKSSSSNNKHDKKHFESSSKHKLKLTPKEQNHEYENIKPNNDVLKSTTLSHEQKDDITSGALKRYLDYQRFLGKYYNNISEHDEKTVKTSCLRDPNLIEERSSNYLKYTKDKEASINVKPIMEQKEKKEKLKLKSTIERAKKKLEPKKKLNSYIDKKISHKQSANNERKKNNEDCHEKISTERMKKKEEIKIKLTSYIANKKKKEKSNERCAKYLKKNEPNKKVTSHSDKREQSKDRKSESSKHTLQKEEYNGKSSNNSERKKMKEETHKKANKVKELGPKNKNIESVQEGIQKSKKSETSTKMNSSSKQRRQKSPTPIRTVDVITKTSCHNVSTNSVSNIDLRSKLTRKRTINQCNTDFARVKSPPARENLLVTLKQKVQAKTPVSSKAGSKPKVQKSKKIKLVINIKCQSSNDDSDEAANESEHEITNENTSPHQDLSFLDDIDIDGIVDSLNAGQRMKSPMRESNIIAADSCNDAHSYENKYNSNVEALNKDCHFNDIRSDLLLLKDEESRSTNNVIIPQAIATKTNIDLLKQYNDDVYEVIDISDDIENKIILVDDDPSLVSTDQKENIKQSMVSHTKVVSGNKSTILLAQSKKVIHKVPIFHINNDSRESTDVIYIEDTEVTQRELPDTKYSIAQFEPKYAIQENPNIELSNVPITPKKENEINIKSEYKGESDVDTSDSISNDADNPHIKKESHSASICLSTNIKKEVCDASIVSLTNIKNEDCDASNVSLTNIKNEDCDTSIISLTNIKNEDCDASIVSLTNIKNEDCDASIVSLTNIKKEARNDVSPISTSVKKEPCDETIHIAKIIKSENVNIQSNTPSKNNDTSPANEISVQKAKIIKSEKTNCASSECDSNSKKDVNQSKRTSVTKKFKTKITNNETKQTDAMTSKTKNLQANPVTSTAPSTKIQSIPKVSALKTDDNVKKPVLKFVKKKCATNPDEPAMSKKIDGNLGKAYINTMEKQMLEYLHKNYTVLDFIHGGYFSNIYKCKDPNGGLYAVKVLKSRFLSMGIYKERIFKGLQKITNKDRYFNLEIISSFNIEEELCLLTEYYPKTLAQALANKKSLHIDVVQTLSRQLVSAVRMLTCNYIVHSDIKPDHILLNSTDERLKLCGFDRADYNYNINIIPSTGTPSYRAPEIILGYNADYKIDVWATALVMYEMASGIKLFPGRYNNQILYHQICTLGPIDIDMLKNGTQVHKHFVEANFMQQVGPKEFICISEFPVESFKPCSFNNNHRKPITLRQVTEGPDKIVMLDKLVKRMLVIHPKHRIPITDVASSEFFY